MSTTYPLNSDPPRVLTPKEWVSENKAKCAYIALIVVGIAALIITTIVVGTTVPEGVQTGDMHAEAMEAGPGEVVLAPRETLPWGYDQVTLSGTASPKVNYLAIRIVNNVAGALVGFGAFSLLQDKEDESSKQIKKKLLAFLIVAVVAIALQEVLAAEFSNSLGKWEGTYRRRIEADFSPTYSFNVEGSSTNINPKTTAMWGSVASSMVAGIFSGALVANARKLREENQETT